MDRPQLTKEDIESALERLGQLASEEGYTIELNVYGGAALTMAYNMRVATGDVDAVSSNPALVRTLAHKVAAERNWPEDWLNEGVKGFLSSVEDLKSQMEAPGIRVQVPTVNYLIAMKAMAMRVDIAEPKDLDDLKTLISAAGYSTAEEVLAVVETHYPRTRIPVKTQYGIEEIMAAIKAGKEDWT